MFVFLLTVAFFLAIEWRCQYKFRYAPCQECMSGIFRAGYDQGVIISPHSSCDCFSHHNSSFIVVYQSPFYHEFLVGFYMYLVISTFLMEYRLVYHPTPDHSWLCRLATSYFMFMALMHQDYLLIVLTPLLDSISIPFYFHWVYSHKDKYPQANRALWRAFLLYVYGGTIVLNVYLSVVAFQSIYPSYVIYVYIPLFISNLMTMCYYF